MREVTTLKLILVCLVVFQSTPLMREVTLVSEHNKYPLRISIHTSHARGDEGVPENGMYFLISIHTSHARGDNY